MSRPDPRFITVPHGEEDVKALLRDLFLEPRALIKKWAEITLQTAQARLAYPGQHLASVVTGVPGMGTAARGEDLIDGSEVKSCSKADQLGQCKNCGTRVQAWMTTCPACESERIDRKDDSHWIISIRREEELQQLLDARRLVLVMFDRTARSLEDIRVRVWEIWPPEDRHRYFRDFITNYFEENYTAKRRAGGDPAPCNLHPLKFDHLMMNPVKVLDATMTAPDLPETEIEIQFLHPAEADRSDLEPEPMSVTACKNDEIALLGKTIDGEAFQSVLRDGKTVDDVTTALASKTPVRDLDEVVTSVPGPVRLDLPMRAKRIKTTPTTYRRLRTPPG